MRDGREIIVAERWGKVCWRRRVVSFQKRCSPRLTLTDASATYPLPGARVNGAFPPGSVHKQFIPNYKNEGPERPEIAEYVPVLCTPVESERLEVWGGVLGTKGKGDRSLWDRSSGQAKPTTSLRVGWKSFGGLGEPRWGETTFPRGGKPWENSPEMVEQDKARWRPAILLVTDRKQKIIFRSFT